MSWKDILKELSDYERAVAEEFATDEDMERPEEDSNVDAWIDNMISRQRQLQEAQQ
jgi:hypothetical protein